MTGVPVLDSMGEEKPRNIEKGRWGWGFDRLTMVSDDISNSEKSIQKTQYLIQQIQPGFTGKGE